MTTHHCVSLAWSESGGFVELWNTIPNNDSSTTTQSTVCALTGPSHRSLPPALTRPHSSTFSLHNCRGHHHTALPQAAAPPSPLTDSSPTLPTHRQQPHPPHSQAAAPPSPLTGSSPTLPTHRQQPHPPHSQTAAPPSPLTDSSPTLPTHRQQPHPPHSQTAAPPSPLTDSSPTLPTHCA